MLLLGVNVMCDSVALTEVSPMPWLVLDDQECKQPSHSSVMVHHTMHGLFAGSLSSGQESMHTLSAINDSKKQ